MRNLDLASLLFLLAGTVAGIAAIYSFGSVRGWLGHLIRVVKATIRGTDVPGSSLDAHIATQWTEGRLRLDSVLSLIKTLAATLEKEVEALRRLDHSDPRYEGEVGQMVEPTLRCFSFDKHLRDECRMLIPLLQFCAQDLAKSQGLDMTEKLSVLAEIQAAIEAVKRD
jgi:hypothetical protein